MAKKKGIRSNPSKISGDGSTETGLEPANNTIRLRGARQHNLKGLDLDFPLRQLTVICGVSGSGKSSLAFETLYAEGQRRYIESFSAYSRQFLERIEKPKFDSLEPLPPSVAVTRDSRSRNNRSTVGTATEVLEYLRIVFAQNAELFCGRCSQKLLAYKPFDIVRKMTEYSDARCLIGFRVRWSSSEELAMILADLQSSGFVRMVVGDLYVHLGDTERDSLAQTFRDQRESFVIVDRLHWTGKVDDRWNHSISVSYEQCLQHEPNQVAIFREAADGTTNVDGKRFVLHSFATSFRCEMCNLTYADPDANSFNFNHPRGACTVCEGFGEVSSIDRAKVVPDPSLSLKDGAIAPWRTPSYTHELEELLALAKEYKLPIDIPVSQLTPAQWALVEKGVPKKNFGGLDGFFAWLTRHKYKMHVRMFLARWRSYDPCPSCEGRRLTQDSLAFRWQGRNFAEVCHLPIRELIDRLKSNAPQTFSTTANEPELAANQLFLASEAHAQYNASEPYRQLLARLEYLESIGLGYVALDRPMHTLSKGEAQRVSLTSLLGSSLVDMLYVFDEPTVGLHPTDVKKVVTAIQAIRDRGNTVILVEHEPDVIQMADRVIEIGPKAGTQGGEVVFDGTPSELRHSASRIGMHLRGEAYHRHKSTEANHWIRMTGASGRNLRNVSVNIPCGRLTAVTGPSGAGKSSLILDTLAPCVARQFGDKDQQPLPYESLTGMEFLSGCLSIDHSPIPRSTRSTPATYCKAMEGIRNAFADSPQAKGQGFGAGHFSFNSESGRCPTCEGLGYTLVEMQFMADLTLPCSDCLGRQFLPEVLEITYRDRNIWEVMQMSIEEAIEFFRGETSVIDRLKVLREIGLGYLPLGQSLSTLSSGESMRLKLASILGGTGTKEQKEIVFLDEPTTGLHVADIEKLILCFEALLEKGHTIVVIEHNEQLISAADYRIELGPGAGPDGGEIVWQGWQGSVPS